MNILWDIEIHAYVERQQFSSISAFKNSFLVMKLYADPMSPAHHKTNADAHIVTCCHLQSLLKKGLLLAKSAVRKDAELILNVLKEVILIGMGLSLSFEF